MKDSRWKVFALQVVDHLENVFAKRNSPNKLKVSMPLGAQPWVADVNDPLYKAAKRAIKTGMLLLFQFLIYLQVCRENVLTHKEKGLHIQWYTHPNEPH